MFVLTRAQAGRGFETIVGQTGFTRAEGLPFGFAAARRRDEGGTVEVSPHTWAELVAMFEEADAEAVAAWSAHDRFPASVNDERATQLEQRYEALRSVARRHEDALLGVAPPTVEAAAYQLRLLGLNHHSTDFAHAAGRETWEKAILRRIYQALARMTETRDEPLI